MNKVINLLMGIGVAISLALVAGFVFAAPTWLIWNNIVAQIFNLPYLSFWDTFWIMIMIRLVIPSETKVKKEKS